MLWNEGVQLTASSHKVLLAKRSRIADGRSIPLHAPSRRSCACGRPSPGSIPSLRRKSCSKTCLPWTDGMMCVSAKSSLRLIYSAHCNRLSLARPAMDARSRSRDATALKRRSFTLDEGVSVAKKSVGWSGVMAVCSRASACQTTIQPNQRYECRTDFPRGHEGPKSRLAKSGTLLY